MKEKSSEVKITITVDEETRAKIKSYCAFKNTTMKIVLKEIVDRWVREEIDKNE